MSIVKGVALITGAAQGIGRSVALRLATDGFDIALNDLPSKRDQLHAVANDIEKMSRRTLLVPGDVTIQKETEGMVNDISEKLGGLDVMVANAGTAQFTSLLAITEMDLWERMMTINARSTFLSYKYAAQQMIKQGRGGRIIGASSTVGIQGLPLMPAYCASKFAVRGLTQSAALELGQYNITVNCYAPGMIETPLSASLVAEGGKVIGEADPELTHLLSSRSHARPIKRNGQPEEIANLVSFLASKDAGLITGQCLAVGGGLTLS